MTKNTHNIQPLFDNVLIKPLDGEQKTASGILLPDSAKEKPQKGEVMAVGPGIGCGECEGCEGKGCVRMVVKVGDKVLYKKWGGNEVKVGTEEWMILEQKDIMAVLK